jgi:membrane associated rhomboid family serine protease
VVFIRVVPLPAITILGLWFLLQLLQVGPVAAGGVAVLAQVGGFVSGAVLIAAFRRHRPRQSLF